MTYPDLNSRSAALFQRARAVMPGGNTRHTVYFAPYPIYAASGQGCTITDVDGISYTDFISNASAAIHGHNHPEIVYAARNQLERLMSVGLPTESEIILAEAIVARMHSVEQLRFCNSGSEAVMFALKAARAFTGKPKIAKIEGAYHGGYDTAETSLSSTPENWGASDSPVATPSSAGAPPGILQDVVVLPLNDIEASQAILEAHSPSLAGVLIDPLMSRMVFAAASKEYLDFLRAYTQSIGALLIFDEVYSFRMGYNGAQGELQVTPDLTALGKIIGGGFPVGAFGGRADIMAVFDQTAGQVRAPHGGTFNGNPMTMAAGAKALELLTPEAHAHLTALGDRARAGIADAFLSAGVEGHARGYGSMVGYRFGPPDYSDYRGFFRTMKANLALPFIHRRLLQDGCLVMPSGCILLSTPMAASEIDHLVASLERALVANREQLAA